MIEKVYFVFLADDKQFLINKFPNFLKTDFLDEATLYLSEEGAQYWVEEYQEQTGEVAGVLMMSENEYQKARQVA
jgi:hypothetical protein